MKAKYVILSVLNKQELFYLKSRYKEMKKLANKHEVSLVEQNFIDAIISMVGYCSLGFGLVSIVNGILLVFSFFQDNMLKSFFLSSIVSIAMFAILITHRKLDTKFSYQLCLKMFYLKIKLFCYCIPAPVVVPDIFINN